MKVGQRGEKDIVESVAAHQCLTFMIKECKQLFKVPFELMNGLSQSGFRIGYRLSLRIQWSRDRIPLMVHLQTVRTPALDPVRTNEGVPKVGFRTVWRWTISGIRSRDYWIRSEIRVDQKRGEYASHDYLGHLNSVLRHYLVSSISAFSESCSQHEDCLINDFGLNPRAHPIELRHYIDHKLRPVFIPLIC